MAFEFQTEFFDLYQIFVNELVGDVFLAILLYLAIIVFLTIKFKMPMQLSILFSIFFLAIMFAETLIIILWVFIGLVIGTLFYFTISKLMEG